MRRFLNWRLLVAGLAGASVVRELRKPAAERTWHGRLFGVVPYDWRLPTPARIKAAFWNPDDPRLLTDRPLGVGWAVNFHRLALRGKRPKGLPRVPADEIVERLVAAARGRRTYEEFASYWPQQPNDVEPAEHMNNTPKVVVSTTLKKLDWQNSTLISGNVAEELNRLKAQPGKNIGITGSGTLVRSLLRDGLLDELSLLVHPLVVGEGKRLFESGTGRVPLKLLASKTFSTGVLWLTYGRG